jgi:membrane fusion protein, copper/silver efflux system
MKRHVFVLIVAGVAAIAAAIGYWFGDSRERVRGGAHESSVASPKPSDKTASASATGAGVRQPRRILYYRHPMGLKDTSPVPKKDSMGMDYVPVYAEDTPPEQAGAIVIAPERVQKLGVRTALAQFLTIDSVLRAVATIEIAEPRQHTIAPKFDGWIERLYVDSTGDRVRRGQTLLSVYSPELVSAQEEYLIALRADEALASDTNSPQTTFDARSRLADAALARLRNWDVPSALIARLRTERIASRSLVLTSPIAATVLDKSAVEGMRFMAGETLYRLADLSVVWAMVDVPEQDLASLSIGQLAHFQTRALPGQSFAGRVSFIYPTVNATSRTVRARIELANRDGRLKPAMFGDIVLESAGSAQPRLAVPVDAVIDSGTRQIVLIARDEGRFEPREVTLGLRGAQLVEILTGLTAGDAVVVAANFLIDAESSLRGSLAGLGDHSAHGSETAPNKPTPRDEPASSAVSEHRH